MNRQHISFLVALCAVTPTVVARAQASVAVVGGASVSHETSGFVGGQGELGVMSRLAIFVEGGKIWDASTSTLAAGVRQIAHATGTTGSAGYEIMYADAGVRLNLPLDIGAEPYIAGGFGAARVRTDATFTSNGRTAPSGASTTQLGTDLSGVATKPMVMASVGAKMPLSRRVFADLSARYNRVLARTSEIPNDHAIDLVRLQAGLGVRF